MYLFDIFKVNFSIFIFCIYCLYNNLYLFFIILFLNLLFYRLLFFFIQDKFFFYLNFYYKFSYHLLISIFQTDIFVNFLISIFFNFNSNLFEYHFYSSDLYIFVCFYNHIIFYLLKALIANLHLCYTFEKVFEYHYSIENLSNISLDLSYFEMIPLLNLILLRILLSL